MQKYVIILSQAVIFSVDSELFELWSIAKKVEENKMDSANSKICGHLEPSGNFLC